MSKIVIKQRIYPWYIQRGEIMKKKKHLKIFAASSLALIMSAGVLCGVLAPVGATSASSAANLAGVAQSPDRAQSESLITPKEDDPVIFTTESGVEIKYANSLSNSNLAGYTYFTMGKYIRSTTNVTYNINWVIIGYDPSVERFVGDFSGDLYQNAGLVQGGFSQTSTIDHTPAGNAIAREMYAISSLAKPNDEIGDGCVLCFSQLALASNAFGSNNNYKDSDLQTFMINLYENNLNLEVWQKNMIVPQDLKQTFGASSSSEVKQQYFFPLSARGEKFDIHYYLNDQSLRIAYSMIDNTASAYWLRSGQSGSQYAFVDETGYTGWGGTYNLSGVRPAFVLKLI